MLDETLYTLHPIHNWEDLIHFHRELQEAAGDKKINWMYRGQKKPDKPTDPDFVSSLERTAQAYSIGFDELPEIERKLVREFKRKLHHYTSDIPDPDDGLEWLALMRHYEAPTRLLDFTYSFYVAVYFALEKADDNGCDVWALNDHYFLANIALPAWDRQVIKNKAERQKRNASRKREDSAHMEQNLTVEQLLTTPTTCVHPVNPFRLNERLTIQQGVFLFPGDISKSFQENLGAQYYALESSHNLVKFEMQLDLAERIRIMKLLYQMNISRATLFPGLGGFAESLKTRLAFLPEI